MAQNITVPDIGDFHDVEVIDVLVKPGDEVQQETPLITLETEKAAMDVPSPAAGVVKDIAVKKGDRVAKGSVILALEEDSGQRTADSENEESQPEAAPKGSAQLSPGEETARTVAASVAGADAGARSAAAPSERTANREPLTASSYDFDLVVLGAVPAATRLRFVQPISA